MSEPYDITVLGGSLVGVMTAIGAAQLGFKVALLEKQAPENLQKNDPRTLALSVATQNILQQYGLWAPTFEKAPLRYVKVCIPDSRAALHLEHPNQHQTPLGFAVPYHTLMQHWFLQQQKVSYVRYQPETYCASKRTSIGWRLDLASGEVVNTRWICVAEGQQSVWAQQRGFSLVHDPLEYHMHVLDIDLKNLSPETAYEIWCSKALVAVIPKGNERYVVIIMHPYDVRLEPEEIMKEVEQALGVPCDHWTPITHYTVRPSEHKIQVGDQFVLLGNTSCVLHPVAAQGFNLHAQEVHSFLTQLKKYRTGNWTDPTYWHAWAQERSIQTAWLKQGVRWIAQYGVRSYPTWLKVLTLKGANCAAPIHRWALKAMLGEGS